MAEVMRLVLETHPKAGTEQSLQNEEMASFSIPENRIRTQKRLNELQLAWRLIKYRQMGKSRLPAKCNMIF